MPAGLPSFNLIYDGWVNPARPATDPPSVTALACQVYIHSRADIDQVSDSVDEWIPPIYLRTRLVDFHPHKGDVVQVNYLLNDYYVVKWSQNIHMGFPNEYVMSLIQQCNAAGVTPRA